MEESLNMDRSIRLAIETASMDWEKSPSAGVSRKKLERQAAESGPVTSVVRYLPDSVFSSHKHPLGEEILVLDGVFEDEYGSYPTGTYIRNPPGSFHAPRSTGGCDLLVKLNMFDRGDQATVRIDTHSADWFPGQVPGLSVMPLHTFGTEHVALVRWEPETEFKPHVHPGGEEIFVLDGVFSDEEGSYPAGTWLRNPPYSHHRPFSRGGCTIWVKTGHMDSG